ncbi:hypothetical protein OCH239_03940 [Roseivivax halodurans JCM 10272]|uniref:Uncharacterized protein n=1 Tax=Roseivivax halodurans JCM 10272 TaxID=1449350 RepID=X7EDR1_9RHOB|nr:hypothetical protein OCH239_03940 [Roseivivax halodurans JCM 10272]
MRIASAAALALLGAGAVVAAEEGGPSAYDRIFVNGTLDEVPADRTLVYDRSITNGFDPEPEEDGRIELSIEGEMARLTLRRDGRHRVLGEFPAGVGNPIIMYFVETVVRDVAEAAGGNPFYIRNRMKEALLEAGEVRDVPGATEVTLHPFADDPNAARMQGFDALTLSAVMSPEVPGLYQTLSASIPETGTEAYSTTLTFDHMGDRTAEETSP